MPTFGVAIATGGDTSGGSEMNAVDSRKESRREMERWRIEPVLSGDAGARLGLFRGLPGTALIATALLDWCHSAPTRSACLR
jgi:hypothetical protein